jgi:hypothetical protein
MPHLLGPAGNPPPGPCPPPPAEPVVRADRQDLHQRLAAEVDRIAAELPRNRDVVVWALLQDAAQAVLTCPHTDRCAICYHLDREETT